MSAIVKTFEATIDEEGKITTDEPNVINFPARVVVSIAVEKTPNEVTQKAMAEPLEDLPRFDTVEELLADLNS